VTKRKWCKSCLHHKYCEDRNDNVRSCPVFEAGDALAAPGPGWRSPLSGLMKKLCKLCAGCSKAAWGCPEYRNGPFTEEVNLVSCVDYSPFTEKKPAEEGKKFDGDKLRWDLVQPRMLQEYVKVLTHGAKKYAPENWRKVEPRKPRYFAALLRHVWAWWLGERDDPDTGLHHLAHAMCCLTFLAEPELEMVESNHDIHTDAGTVRGADSTGEGGSGPGSTGGA
jgi:hypothetical protein